MRIVITGSGKQLSEADIDSFEKDLKISLPSEYRNFLLKNNGGYVEPNIFYYRDEDNFETNSAISIFFPLDSSFDNCLQVIVKAYRKRVPSHLMPIASDVFGNLVCLGVSERNQCKIYFWDHERESNEFGDEGNVFLVADSLHDFLLSLLFSEDD